MRKIHKILLALTVLLFSFSGSAAAEEKEKKDYTIVNCFSTQNAVYSEEAGGCIQNPHTTNADAKMTGLESVLNSFAYSITYLSLGIALILIVFSGFQYTLSEGDSYKIEEAKNNLLRAGIGMLVSFSIFSIMNLINVFENFQ